MRSRTNILTTPLSLLLKEEEVKEEVKPEEEKGEEEERESVCGWMNAAASLC